jgi:hypothetical protein
MDHDPIYVNVAINTGINSTAATNILNSSTNISYQSNDAIILDPSQYYISLNRVNLFLGSLPRYIFPIQNGIAQGNMNLSPFVIKFSYFDALNVLVYSYEDYVIYQSQVLDSTPLAPSANNGFQDFVNVPLYYYLYDVSQMTKIFNDNIQRIWAQFVANIAGPPFNVALGAALYPFYTFNTATEFYTFNAPVSLFDQNVLPHVNMYQDFAGALLTDTPSNALLKSIDPANLQLSVFNLFNNKVTYNNVVYYAMDAAQSSLIYCCPVKRVIFTISNVPIKKYEYDTSFDNVPFVASNNGAASNASRPNLPIFFDLGINPDTWPTQRNNLFYSVSSIAESRLVALGSGSPIKNFSIQIFWADTFNNIREIVVGPNTQSSLKLAFFKKTSMLL